MTKHKEVTATEVQTDVVKDTSLPANSSPLFVMTKASKGGGLSDDQSDNLVPLIYLLQPLSPQCLKGDAQRIENAESGDIWLRNADPPIIKGEEGMLFQPCFFYKDLVEWVPNRGGFVGRHDIACMPHKELDGNGKPYMTKWSGTLSDVKEIPDEERPNAPPRFVRSSNNNEIVETRYFVGNVYPKLGQPLPYIIPLSSTGHTFGMGFMTQMRSQSIPATAKTIAQGVAGDPIRDAWAVLYRLKPKMKTNALGSWYQYTAQRETDVYTINEENEELAFAIYARGKALYESFLSNEKKIDDSMMNDTRATNEAGPLNNNEPL